ncbi:MAG: MOSC domain-containing protein [Sphingomonas sp.]|uniref:MOSC domain-containing protein n=1 Tax=Sphingomonas sp. TaxID=28214 RepID=UPI0025EFD91B|nr:MOSC N-terminal beta barrel domain-containing protein [Sphingomonas sp.]MBX3564458.1 MOSC domain-containing protein [Sphingomonas sp.]
MGEIIGTVAALNRFPVKSMAGEPLETAEIDWQGVEGDRQYAFFFRDSGSRFPWLTGRDVSEMVLHAARFADPQAPKTAKVEVTAPDGWHGTVDDPELLERLAAAAGAPIGLIQLAIGCFDSMPVSVVTTAAHHWVETAHGSALDMRRFRANIVIESDHSQMEWAGKRIAFGEDGAELLITEGIQRCAMVTIHPDTAVREPKVLRTVAQQFGNNYGTYAAPAKKGFVRIGDVVRLID